MTEQELNRRLKQALDAAAPDDLDGVLSRCAPREETVVPLRPKRRSHTRALIAACLTLVLVGGAGGVFYQRANAVASVVSLDVNPSIELKVNQKEKVLACTPLNEEAEAVLSGMGGGADLNGTKLEVAVNAVVGALVSSGYLDSLSSAILISVEDQDQDRASRLRQELTRRCGLCSPVPVLGGRRPQPDGGRQRRPGPAGQGTPHLHRKGQSGQPGDCPEWQPDLRRAGPTDR